MASMRDPHGQHKHSTGTPQFPRGGWFATGRSWPCGTREGHAFAEEIRAGSHVTHRNRHQQLRCEDVAFGS